MLKWVVGLGRLVGGDWLTECLIYGVRALKISREYSCSSGRRIRVNIRHCWYAISLDQRDIAETTLTSHMIWIPIRPHRAPQRLVSRYELCSAGKLYASYMIDLIPSSIQLTANHSHSHYR
jgi:hypothetical protein